MFRVISYESVSDDAISIGRHYFTVRNFARLSKGRISISAVSLFNFIVRKEWFCQTKIALSLYDASGQGYLTENVSLFFFLPGKELMSLTPVADGGNPILLFLSVDHRIWRITSAS